MLQMFSRFRFGVRTLFVATSIAACIMAVLANMPRKREPRLVEIEGFLDTHANRFLVSIVRDRRGDHRDDIILFDDPPLGSLDWISIYGHGGGHSYSHMIRKDVKDPEQRIALQRMKVQYAAFLAEYDVLSRVEASPQWKTIAHKVASTRRPLQMPLEKVAISDEIHREMFEIARSTGP